MPQTPDRKAEYQRKRRQAKTASPTNESSEEVVPGQRDRFGDMIVSGPTGTDLGGEHYWMRGLGEDFATCTAFEFYGPGQWIGGCGMVKQYEGKLLEGGFTLAQAIISSDRFKEIQAKMPVTKTRG